MKFLYLHGFNSGFKPEDQKIKTLEQLGKVEGITYNTYSSYDRILKNLLYVIGDSKDLVMVGTSLGGYWAYQVAKKLHVPSVIINPFYNPYQMLAPYVDIVNMNNVTGASNSLSLQVRNSYKDLQLSSEDYEDFVCKPLVLLDSGDEVLSAVQNENVLKKFTVKKFQGGSHQFTHMEQALPYIKNYIEAHNVVEYG